ncbi:DUF2299 domain-containing protein [Archaeoglobus profundus]|uniref:DUF2299 domain-containing protein n=1 Tax=Archaeoglobus profundus (strain DSM 5631 / JCM 9629 / NBRC 100127 / Av18) TaxID=572546 RepID=D2RF01_ARCPA|nr:DUF2299 domain-containing protein [Archaeoglobus profundus]ADB58695.1 conserved hypothetical protein [Archaeoglobus profundus DSM 5631]
MKDVVKSWLVEEGILKAEVPDENAEWHFLVEFPPNSKQMCDVIKLKHKDIVLVVSGIVLSDDHYKALHSLPEEKKRALIHRWKIDLLFRNAEFRMIPDAENVKQIEFQVPLYLEELTKSELMKALREVFKCKLYIIWSVNYEFEKRKDLDAMYL